MPILRLPSLAMAAMLATSALTHPAAARTADEAPQAATNAETLPGAYLAAKMAQADGALDVAADYFEKALQIAPQSEVVRQEAMFAFLAEGRFDEGVALAADLVDDVDTGKVARIAMGIDAIRQGRTDEALRFFSLDEPGDLDRLLLSHLSAWAEAEGGRFEDAVARIDAIEGPPWFPIFNLYQKGLIQALAGDATAAKRTLRELVADEASVQTSPDAYLAAIEALARIEAGDGDRQAALATIERGLELAPTYDPLLYLRERIEEVAENGDVANEITVEAGDSLWRIAERVYGDGRQFGRLVAANAEALRDSGGRLSPGQRLRAPSPEAGASFAEAPVSNARGGASEALYVLGQAINRGDGQQVALLYFQFADALADEASPKLLTALAGTVDRSTRVDRAISYYQRIPVDSPFRRTADLQMGLDLWYAERREESVAHLREAVNTYPDDLQALLAYADVLSASKDYAEAATVLERALEIAPEDGPNNWNIYYQRGIAYERMQEWEKAEPNFLRALELSPDQPQVLNYLGYSWVDMNRNLEEGLDMIRTAVDLRPNDGYIIDSLGWAYYRLERFEEAVEELERAALIMPADPTVNDHLGDAYWRVGREREARFQWQRALKGTPEPDAELSAQILVKLKEGLGPVGSDTGELRERASNETADEVGAQAN